MLLIDALDHIATGSTRRAIVSSNSLSKEKEIRQVPFENLKIEVQFDRNTKRAFKDLNSQDRPNKGGPLGVHKRDNTRAKQPADYHQKKPEMSLHEKVRL